MHIHDIMTSHARHQHVYLCGFNGFQQIDKAIGTHDMSSGFYTQPVMYICTQKLPDIPTKVWFTWSQIWIFKESGQVDVFGLNEEEICQALTKANVHPQTVVAYGNNTMIQTQDSDKMDDGTISLLTEDGSIHTVICNIEKLTLVDSTGTYIGALKDGKSFTGTVSIAQECPSLLLTYLNFDRQVSAVACGFNHTLMLTVNGQVYSMGSCSRGQLGHGDTSVDIVHTPTLIQALHGLHMVTIAAGGWHSAAVSDSGDLYVWGWNEAGQLGLPNGSIDRSYDTSCTQPCDISESCDTSWETNEPCSYKYKSHDQDSNNSMEKSHDPNSSNNRSSCNPMSDSKSRSCDSSSSNKDKSCDYSSCDSGKSSKDRSCDPSNGNKDRSCDPSSGSKDRSCDPSNGSKDRSCDPSSGSKDRSCDPSSGSKDRSCDPSNGSKDRSCDPSSGSKDRSCDPSSGSKDRSCDPDFRNLDRSCGDSTKPVISWEKQYSSPPQDGYSHGVPLSLVQDIDPVLIQAVPYGLDIPNDVRVKTVVCGSRHTCVLFDSGYLMTTGWNKYGQLGHGNNESIDRLKTVMSLVHKQEKVVRVFANQWNTAIFTTSNKEGCSCDVT